MSQYIITTEADFHSHLGAIEAFWQQGTFASFKGVSGIEIAYAFFPKVDAKATIFISPGRIEGFLKYQELVFDLSQNGYEIAIIDHRGQGFSGRMLTDPEKGYVDTFDDYVEDLHQLFTLLQDQRHAVKAFILGHSMGSAISARYLQKFPHHFNAAVLSSPMIGINTAPHPRPVARLIVGFLHRLNRLFGGDSWYMLGQNGYQPDSFNENKLTQSDVRYCWFRDLYERNPQLKLGGVTLAWLRQGLKVEHQLFDQVDCIETPVRILQSGKDTVVDNDAQDKFCAALASAGKGACPDGKVIRFDGALHELFIEADQYRTPAFEAILDWFERHL